VLDLNKMRKEAEEEALAELRKAGLLDDAKLQFLRKRGVVTQG